MQGMHVSDTGPACCGGGDGHAGRLTRGTVVVVETLHSPPRLGR